MKAQIKPDIPIQTTYNVAQNGRFKYGFTAMQFEPLYHGLSFISFYFELDQLNMSHL